MSQPPESSSHQGVPAGRRALRPWTVDLARRGVQGRHHDGDVAKAVWRTALAAVNAGWTESEWTDLLTARGRDGLWQQYQLRKGKPHPLDRCWNDLTRVWGRAVRYVAEHPPWEHWLDEITERADAVRKFASDPASPLGGHERAILAYAAGEAERLGSASVPLPRKATADATGLPPQGVRHTLDRLCARGVLCLVERGVPGGPRAKKRKANTYRLPDPAGLAAVSPWSGRKTGGSPDSGAASLVGPQDNTFGSPAGLVGPQASAVPPPTTREKESHAMRAILRLGDLELTAEESEAVALYVLERRQRAREQEQPGAAPVIHLDDKRARSQAGTGRPE